MKPETKVVLIVSTAWFCFALAVGLAGWLQNASAPFVAGIVWTLTGLVLLACWKVGPINTWARNVDLSRLILFHATRFIGIYFLILCRRGELSCAFAKPAGVGDILVASIALFLLVAPWLRVWPTLLRIWNFFGFVDIIFVAFAALRIGLRDWESMAPLRELPLSLLPTFLVPLIIASHVLIFFRIASRRGFQQRA